ncbi:MAG: prolyl oligopeptidase family serine peptidase, partial [Actinomycetales bacterium]
MSAFDSLDDFIALPRVTGLLAAADASRLVVSVATLDRAKSRYLTSLWAVDPAGRAPVRRLTRSLDGEAAAAFTPTGDLLFTAREPGAADDDPQPLWLLPADGGQARVVARHRGGFDRVRVAAASGEVLVGVRMLASAANAQDDERLRSARSTAAVDAILHEGYPVRHWDSDLGPGAIRLHLAASVEASGVAGRLDDELVLRPLTGHVEAALDPEASWRITADGRQVISDWATARPHAETWHSVVQLDVQTGARTDLAAGDDQHEYALLAVSPDARLVAVQRRRRSTPELAPTVDLCVVERATGHLACLTEGVEHWVEEAVFSLDSGTVYFTADAYGRRPVFAVPADGHHAPRRLTDEGFFSGISAGPDYLVGLRSSYLEPAHPVRIELSAGHLVHRLPTPAPAPDLPGQLREIECEVPDGAGADPVRVRGYLALPQGASAERPAPLLLFVHGGPLGSWNTWSWRWCPWVMVARGYAVLLPDPALSTGYGDAFIQRGWGAWGAAPYTDLMAITDEAERLPEIDHTRVAAAGGSFGGYMANWIAGHTDRFRCIVSHAGLWALEQFAPTTDAAHYWRHEMTPQMTQANSPALHVERIVSPMLVLHGALD